MKKVFAIGVVVLILGFLGFWYMQKQAKSTGSPKSGAPAQVNVKLPSGEVVKAYRSLKQEDAAEKAVKSDSDEFVVQGIALRESDGIIDSTVILSDSGEKFVLFNAPYVNTISKELIGKKIELRCKPFGTTSFKKYKGIWIEDILKVE